MIKKNKHKMKKRIRLTERDLMRIVKRVLFEGDSGDQTQDSFPEYEGRTDIYVVDSNIEKDEDNIDTITQQVAEYWTLKRNRYKIK